VMCVAGASRYLAAAQPDASSAPQPGSASDPAAWSMTFNQADSTMRFIGFRGRDLIRFAYQIPEARVTGGPRWLDEQILNIVINLDTAPRADQMPGIVREALESRLQLKTHVEKRNFPVLALVIARKDRALGPGLRAASRPCFDLQQWIAAGQPPDQLPERRGVPVCGAELDTPLGWTQYASITMSQFADELRDYVKGWPITPREPPPARSGPARLGPALVAVRAPEVVDRTGLSGRYDVEFSALYPTAALMSRFPYLTNVLEPLGFHMILEVALQLGFEGVFLGHGGLRRRCKPGRRRLTASRYSVVPAEEIVQSQWSMPVVYLAQRLHAVLEVLDPFACLPVAFEESHWRDNRLIERLLYH